VTTIGFDLGALTVPERSRLITRIVAPRPIAFVSTLSASGMGNLSPFSFFNAGGYNPASVIFSPVNDRHGIGKHTLHNIEATREYVINVVTFAMGKQMNQASFEYAEEIDEFDVSGFTRVPSVKVKPPGVAESPVRLECRLHEIVHHGSGAGASNYVIGELVHIEVNAEVCTDGIPDDRKLDLIGRLGADLYTRMRPESFFDMARPKEA
jgi:flavin reductase (DIM6/NTAB) family NADH-FMN oxidoreductase RutF